MITTRAPDGANKIQIQKENKNTAKYSVLVKIGMGLRFDMQSDEGGHGPS